MIWVGKAYFDGMEEYWNNGLPQLAALTYANIPTFHYSKPIQII